jgi:CubicO group peptidase (beta-lactamase class C family)
MMKLHERGRVRLGDPISVYLPAELTKGLHRLGGADRTDEITLRHLLGHATGLPDYLEERPRDSRSLLERVVQEGDRSWDIHDIVTIVRGLTPHFPPQALGGDRHRIRYSDTNYLLLIAVIEAVTGLSQHDVFEDLLFRPLNLRHTWLPGHSEPRDRIEDPAAVWYRDRSLDIPQAMSSFGDLYSTVEDTIAFLRALTRGEVFDDPATLDLMTSRWTRFGFPRDMAALRAPGWPIQYGLGVMRFRFRIPRVRTPDGQVPELIGHSGSTGSWLFRCPQLDVLLSGTVNQATAGAVPFRFLPRLLREIGKAMA